MYHPLIREDLYDLSNNYLISPIQPSDFIRWIIQTITNQNIPEQTHPAGAPNYGSLRANKDTLFFYV